MANFVHLRAMTSHGAGAGGLSPAEVAGAAAAIGAAAVAISDLHGVYGAVQLGQAARASGLKPIIATELCVQERQLGGSSVGALGTLLLVATTPAGYKNLVTLSGRAWTTGWIGRQPRVDMATLAAHAGGLVVLAGGPDSVTGQRLSGARRGDPAARIHALLDIFGPERVFVELQHGDGDGPHSSQPLVALARDNGLRLVATADCRWRPIDPRSEWTRIAHRVNPETGHRHETTFTADQSYAGADTMAKRFQAYPSALTNSLRIAEMVEADACPQARAPVLPRCPWITAGEADAELAGLAHAGLANLQSQLRLDTGIDAVRYAERLVSELAQIRHAGCAEAFLIYADLARHARCAGIAVGPGRGATGSSLVCWTTGVSDMDPLGHNLVFEGLLAAGEGQVPALSMDVAWDRREQLIDYLAERYGGDRLGLISRRDDSPMAAFDGDAQVERGRARPQGLRNRAQRAGARGLSGIVICPEAALDCLPLMRDAAGNPTCQYSRTDVETLGYWVLDVAGFRPLAQISAALGAVNQLRSPADRIDVEDMHLEDPAIYAQLGRGETAGVFQVSGREARRLMRTWSVDQFTDLLALTAIFRPNTLSAGLGDTYADRKHGRTPATPPVAFATDVLATSYGLILFQEQVIHLIARATGCSLHEANDLRRALGKGMRMPPGRERQAFVNRALAHGTSDGDARRLYSALEEACGHAFVKAHAVNMAIITARTAWIRNHFPLQWAWASLEGEEEGTRAGALLVDAQRRGVDLRGPDVNHSLMSDAFEGDALRLGLRWLRALATPAAEAIVAQRRQGPFSSIDDLVSRLPRAHATVANLDVLACAGALDELVEAEPDPLLRRTRAANEARGHAAARQGKRPSRPVGPGCWTLERLLSEEQRAMGGLTVSGWRLVGALAAESTGERQLG